MKQLLRTVLAVFLAVLTCFLVLVAWARLRPPTTQERVALATLREPVPPVRGRDGSNAQLLLQFDVPESRHAELGPKSRAYLVRVEQLRTAKLAEQAAAIPDPRDKFPKWDVPPKHSPYLCADRGPGCLEKVWRQPSAVERELTGQRGALQAYQKFVDTDGTRFGMPPSYDQEMPSWGGSLHRELQTWIALEFAKGQRLQALSELCRDISGWRRHGTDTDMLVGNMVAVAYASQDLMLLADMVAEMPDPIALPVECNEALSATQPQELSICASVKHEFYASQFLVEHQIVQGQRPLARAFTRAAISASHFEAVIAPSYAEYCRDRIRGLALADQPVVGDTLPQPECGIADRLGDPITCYLAALSGSTSLPEYQNRRTDLAAFLALTRAVVLARQYGSGDWEKDLRNQATAAGLRRVPSISADGRTVSIALISKRQPSQFTLAIRPRLAPAVN